MVNKTRVYLVVPCMWVVLAWVGAASGASDTVADLIYDPATGKVWVNAAQAGGGRITSFQFENTLSTFKPGNYIGLTGGTFGTPVSQGGYEDVTTKVIADSDLTLAGFTGIHDFGKIFPAGMSLVQLDAYLKTKVYTGKKGTGWQNIDLQLISGTDTNFDGVTDAADYIVLKKNFGKATTGGPMEADFDRSGLVDWSDLQMLLLAIPPSGAGSPAVPEPATLGLLAVGALAVVRRRRK